jgi:hypothetical protein
MNLGLFYIISWYLIYDMVIIERETVKVRTIVDIHCFGIFRFRRVRVL